MATARIKQEKEKWSEREIQQAIRMQIFKGAFTMVPNCSWTGNECDLLIVDKSLRIIDIEVKISRSDFKADYQKEKWWKHIFMRNTMHGAPLLNDHPIKVWKHYYCMPRDIWSDDLFESMPSKSSGVLLISRSRDTGRINIWLKHYPKPNKNADKLSAEDVFDLARLGNYRMWNALTELELIKNKEPA